MTVTSAPADEPVVLTLNGGSSSLKFAVFTTKAPLRRLASGSVSRVGQGDATLSLAMGSAPAATRALGAVDHEGALDAAIGELERARPLVARTIAVGHRIAHGGPRYDRAELVTPDVIAELRRISALAPDHLPSELAILEAMRARTPAIPHVASFDTAFHHGMPRVSRILPIPRKYEAAGVLRYGFHGLSYTFLMEELARQAGDDAARGRIVLAHLGAGASLAAVVGGRSIDTTMGFTPTSGIMMGTRSGDLDPGVLVHLLRDGRMSVGELDELLNRRSGLVGVSETSPDMRDLLAREASDERAADAVALFVHLAKKAVGALAATLGGIQTLVFSGGIGERSPIVRARITRGLEHLGVRLDDAKNDAGASVISTDASACTVRIIPTDEESVIARQALSVVAASRG